MCSGSFPQQQHCVRLIRLFSYLISLTALWFLYSSNLEDSFSTPGECNFLDQMDRLLRAGHSGNLALQTEGAFPVDWFIQESEHMCPDGRWGDVRRNQEETDTSRKDEVADDILICPLGKNQRLGDVMLHMHVSWQWPY